THLTFTLGSTPLRPSPTLSPYTRSSDLGTASTPTGTVTFTSSGSGTFSSATCTLSGGSCSVTYTPSAVGTGTHTITASYSGDTRPAASTGATEVRVNKGCTITPVRCTPG